MKNLSFIGQPNYCVTEDGRIYSLKSSRFLKSFCDKQGYHYIEFYENGGKTRFAVHRLVAMSFINNHENKPEVNHKDGVKSNNCVDNLEWVTSSENSTHAERTGLRSNATLSDEKVHDICRKICDGFKNTDIAKMFGISRAIVSDIKNRKTYKYISDEYPDFLSVPRSQRLCVETVIKICEMLQLGTSYSRISSVTGVKSHLIGRIKRRLHFTDISVNYLFN